MNIINQDNNRIVLTDTKPSDMETLYKYYDAVRTGDPDRQVNDGVDIKAIEFAIQRITELEKQIETGISAYADLLGNSMNEIRELGEQLKAIKETQSAEVHDLKEQLRIRGERLEEIYRYSRKFKYSLPNVWLGWFDDNGKAL